MSPTYYPRPDLLASLPDDRHAVIEASAGTGKTYTLEHLVIDLLIRRDVTLDQLLVVTFTDKAAAELRARLRRKFQDILHARGAVEPSQGSWCIDDLARTRLRHALACFDSAAISTIHGFCHRMLSEHAFDNLRLFDSQLVDSRAAFTRAFYAVLRKTLAREERFQAFLEAWLDDHTLDQLIDLLFEAHARRGQVQPRLHLDQLSLALGAALKLPLDPNSLRPALNRACAPPGQLRAILRRVALLRQLLQRYLRTGRVAGFLCELSAAEHTERHNEGLLPYLIDRLSRLIRQQGLLHTVRDGLKALHQASVPMESAIVQVFLPQVQATLAQNKADRGELDFDDMPQLLQANLAHPDGHALVQTLRRRYRFALIDEFQDTDELQWRIFEQLFVQDGAQGNLLLIGDPKQAIYGFRGADVTTYLEAKARLVEGGASAIHLTQNHRSGPLMVQALNLLFQQSRARPFFTGQIRYEHPITCGDPTRPAVQLGADSLAPVHLMQVRAQKKTLSSPGARRTLAEAYALRIQALLSSGSRGGGPPLSPHDIFVLTRTSQEGLEVGRHLRSAGVPHAFYKQDGLFQTQEADDIRAMLAAIAEPGVRARRLRAWQSPFFAVPVQDLAACRDLSSTHPYVQRLLMLRELADAKDYDRLFTRIIEDSGIVERALFTDDSERELTNYLHIFEILQEQASRSKGTLSELIHTLTAFIEGRRRPEGQDGNVQRLESEREAVQIMTMHKAKGLEAEVVFIFGGYDRVPSRSHVYHEERRRCLWVGAEPPPEAEVEAEQEDQRLLYVALTRARSHLVLPYFGLRPGADASGPPTREFEGLKGCYAQLNARLDDVVTQLDDPELGRIFSFETLDERRLVRQARASDTQVDLRDWQPPQDMLQPGEPPQDLMGLRQRHQGRSVTSYSHLKALAGGYRRPEPRLPERPGEDDLFDPAESGAAPRADAMMGGSATGRLLHELLQDAPFEGLRRASSALDWGTQPEVRALFEAKLRRHGRDPGDLEPWLQLVFTTLTAPIPVKEGLLTAGLCALEGAVKEMEFLFPVPTPPGAPPRLIKGFIDLVFEDRGRAYLLDYKSDRLPQYAPEDLEVHMGHNYSLQVELYSLALVRYLGLVDEASYEARYGGAVYAFMRGMQTHDTGHPGVIFCRPTWAELVACEQSLAEVALGPGPKASA